ncbi:hypothetical protein Nmel_001822 [Mimus melanotis]
MGQEHLQSGRGIPCGALCRLPCLRSPRRAPRPVPARGKPPGKPRDGVTCPGPYPCRAAPGATPARSPGLRRLLGATPAGRACVCVCSHRDLLVGQAEVLAAGKARGSDGCVLWSGREQDSFPAWSLFSLFTLQ